MNRANIIVTAIVVAVIASYFGYLGYKKSEKRENIFSQASKVKYESLGTDYESDEIFSYDNKPYFFNSLPNDLQKQIRTEQIASHTRTQAMIKDYVVRYHVYSKSNQDKNGNVDVEKIPGLSTYIRQNVPKKEVLDLYQKNIKVFGKNHNKEHILRQIEVELMAKKAYEFVNIFLTEIYYQKGLELPAAPPIARKWIQSPLMKSFSDDPAPYELIWIGSYGCEKCEQYSADIGLILKKWGAQKLRLKFVPWSSNDLDSFQSLNINALCIDKLKGSDAFWRFHALAMSSSSKLKGLKGDDFSAVRRFSDAIIKQLEFNKDKNFKKNYQKCSSNYSLSKNPLLKSLVDLRKQYKFLRLSGRSNFIFNGRPLDLEGRRLLLAVDQYIEKRETGL